MEAEDLGVKGIGTEKGQAEKEFHKVTHQALTKSTMYLSQTYCNRHPRGKPGHMAYTPCTCARKKHQPQKLSKDHG